MPVYEYECSDCKNVLEVQQKMAEEPLTVCPECEGTLKKLISTSSFQLKGGGWYADGYSSTSGKSAPKKKSGDSASACASGGGCKGCPAATAT